MLVDAPTLLIALTLTHLAGATLFFVAWRLFSNRFEANVASLGLWSLALLLFCLGSVLVGLRSHVSDLVSIVVGNTLLLFASGIARMAIGSFFGRKLHFVLAALPGVLWCVLCAYPPFVESFFARFIFVQLAIGGNLIWMSLVCFRQNQDSLLTSRLTGVTTLAQAAGNILYVINAYFAGTASFLELLQQDFARIILLSTLFCTVASFMLIFAMFIEKEQLFFRTQARHDPLTGLSNRRAFLETINDWVADTEDPRTPFAVANLDIDHFKTINGKYGRALGDALLQLLGRICVDNAGSRFFVGHLSGDRFTVFFAGMPIGKAAIFAEQIRHKFTKASMEATAGRLKSTVSAGLSGGDIGGINVTDALRAADIALAKAKKSGRNRLSMSVVMTEEADEAMAKANVAKLPQTSQRNLRRQSKML